MKSGYSYIPKDRISLNRCSIEYASDDNTRIDLNRHCPTTCWLLSLFRISSSFPQRPDTSVIVFPLFRPIPAAFSKIILREHVMAFVCVTQIVQRLFFVQLDIGVRFSLAVVNVYRIAGPLFRSALPSFNMQQRINRTVLLQIHQSCLTLYIIFNTSTKLYIALLHAIFIFINTFLIIFC